MRFTIFAIALVTATSVSASPPPPPPEYVWAAAEQLRTFPPQDAMSIAAIFSDDVIVTENGKVLAKGRAEWLHWRDQDTAQSKKNIVGYSASSARSDSDGELLVVETFDMVDRSKLPSTVLADPWIATRSTLYLFGSDHLVHSVVMSKSGGFWIAPRR